ncbi:MAG: pseudouridine synthase, partial [Bacteroidota bacterium]|nr:pseudouridine synthase [Bacteroidota bacterium]
MLHKPYGYLSQFVGEAQKKKRLGELYPFPAGTMAIGRLDQDSEGLLLLTTNGKVSTFFTSSKMEKEYYVQVDGLITPEAIEQLQQGVEIGLRNEKYQTKPCIARKLDLIPNFAQRSRK